MESSKTVATTGCIIDLTPVPDSDNLLAATVVCGNAGKWHGVVNRQNSFELGDLVEVYLPDAILPQEDRFAFMANKRYKVRIARLRGALSEVLIMPLSPGVAAITNHPGTSIMDVVGVVKYVKDNIDPRMALGAFPSHTPKTDEINMQAAANELVAMYGLPWVATVKYDGTSTTAYEDNGELMVCSRNLIVKGGEHWAAAKRYGLESKLDLFRGIALQWETVGPGIQKNPAKLPDVQARLFGGFRVATQEYISFDELVALAADLAIPMAETVAFGDAFNLRDDEVAALTSGRTYPGTNTPIEGVVVRAMGAMPRGDKLSFKYINPDYKE